MKTSAGGMLRSLAETEACGCHTLEFPDRVGKERLWRRCVKRFYERAELFVAQEHLERIVSAGIREWLAGNHVLAVLVGQLQIPFGLYHVALVRGDAGEVVIKQGIRRVFRDAVGKDFLRVVGVEQDAVRHSEIVNQHTPEIVVERGRHLLDFERLAVRIPGCCRWERSLQPVPGKGSGPIGEWRQTAAGPRP